MHSIASNYLSKIFNSISSSFRTRRYASFGMTILVGLVIKQRPVSTKWPETQLGPIDSVNPKYPLPGNVGVIGVMKHSPQFEITSAAVNLPCHVSEHYASVMVQALNVIEVCALLTNSYDNLLNTYRLNQIITTHFRI